MVRHLPTLALLGLLLPSVAEARGGYGANHTDVAWRTLETEHFWFHWPESTRDRDDPHWFTTEFSVSELARIAEQSYPGICDQFDYYLEEKIHVVVYDQDEGWEGNGFAIAEWDQTGFGARWGSTFRQRGRMEFLSDVFVHEFAHIVSLKAYAPWSEGTSGFTVGGMVDDEEWLKRWGWDDSVVNFDIGFDVTGTVHTPFWWAEGGAEYWSHMAGYNFWGSSRDAFLRMSVVEGRVLSKDEWTTRADKEGFDGERGYNHGYAFSLYLADRFQEDVISKMARIAGERWHWSWDKVVEEATGVDATELVADWHAHLEAHYGAQVAAIEAEGLVIGEELSLTKPDWVDPDEDWLEKKDNVRQEEMDGNTSYKEMPSVSPDGEYMIWFDQGLNLRNIRPEQWGAISGEWADGDDKKLMKAWSRKTASVDWAQYYRATWAPDSKRFAIVANEDVTHQGLMDLGLTFDADGYNWSQLMIGEIDDSGKQLDISWTKIPNTLRGLEPAWSPDGKRIAFLRYGDGTHEIWTIRPDGSEAALHTQFGDGTQVQGVSWTPDGRQLLVSLFRNFQQDLWLFSPDLRTWKRLTDSKADETDPIIGPDGRAWFASDPDGVFNVYAMDLESGEVRKQTNVLGSAYGVAPAPGGHLFYSAITGHGFRILGVNGSQLKDELVAYDGSCLIDGCWNTTGFLGYRPDKVDVLGTSKKYNAFRGQLPLSAWPVIRTADRNVEAGMNLFLGDAVEGHYLEALASFGKDTWITASYWNSLWWPDLTFGYSRYAYKGTYGFGLDQDDLPETDDLLVTDVKFEQVSDDLWFFASYSPSYALSMGIGADGSVYGFRDAGDGNKYSPYMMNGGIGAWLEWSPHDPWYSGEDWINPRGSRRLYLDYSFRGTKLLDNSLGGAVYDDGEQLDRYTYHRLAASYTEFIPINWFGKTPRHTLQLDFDFGWISRNVISWDEFVAGGRHPYHWGNGTIGNNVQFSGYEGWSLNGETMLIANASYRFPIVRDLNWKTGPIYTDAFWFQVFGSIGNLWSYRVDGPAHTQGGSLVADDPGDIRREAPFLDYASKNSVPGSPNYALSDLGAELRVRSFIWNDFDWDSFVRVSYGFRPTAGYGDVNSDMVQGSIARDAVTELSNEFEPPRIRVYVGFGTGW